MGYWRVSPRLCWHDTGWNRGSVYRRLAVESTPFLHRHRAGQKYHHGFHRRTHPSTNSASCAQILSKILSPQEETKDMPESSHAKKMKIKPGLRAAVIHAPEDYLKELKHDSEILQKLNGQFDWIQIFVQNKKELDSLAPQAAQALKADSILWIS